MVGKKLEMLALLGRRMKEVVANSSSTTHVIVQLRGPAQTRWPTLGRPAFRPPREHHCR